MRTRAASVEEHRLVSDRLVVGVIPLGATLSRVELDGTSVALCLPRPTDYADTARNPHLGATAGRFANRIAGARFTLDGVEHHLVANEGPDILHGGPHGFGRRHWSVEAADGAQVRLVLHSADGDQGFPGSLVATTRYALDGDTLRITYEAVTDAPTVVNLTNHTYWNLAGWDQAGAPASAHDHVLAVAADRYLPVEEGNLPSGEIRPVAGSRFDLRAARRLGDVMGEGFDHCFVLGDDETAVRHAALLRHPRSGRWLQVRTNQTGVQVYTGQHLGPPFVAFGAVCLETQRFPDAPNQPAFPSAVLRPGATYRNVTEVRLGTGPPQPP